MNPQTTPVHLDLKRDERLEIHWQDGRRCIYPITLLRSMCPCAMCKEVRRGESQPEQKPLLQILPGNYSTPIQVVTAELVGNYAIRIEWSDQHGTGIFSFEYLRELSGQ